MRMNSVRRREFVVALAGGNSLAANEPIRFFAVGDVAFIGAMGERATTDASYPFGAVREGWRGADAVFANLESPLTGSNRRTRGKKESEVRAGKDFILKSPPQAVHALKAGGVTLVSLANNHTLDYEAEGLTETLRLLKRMGIAHAGAGANRAEAMQPAVLKLKQRSLALFAFSSVVPPRSAATEQSPGIARLKTDDDLVEVCDALADAARTHHFVLVSIHWGKQLAPRSNAWQQGLAQRLIAAGADAILGHHPHVLQETALHRGKPIVYSMGNFVFGRSGTSAIYELQLTAPHAVGIRRTIPVLIRAGRPELAKLAR